MTLRSLVIAFCALLLLAPRVGRAEPQGSGFTYQGRLSQANTPYTGGVALRFTLWDAAGTGDPPTGGTQVGSPQLLAAVPVTEGLFSVTLNAAGEFGAQAFAGEQRWLQVEVCADAECASSTVLGPRQAITGAPYALGPWRLSGTNLVYSGGNVGVGTETPGAPLHVRTSGEGLKLQGTSGSAWIGFTDGSGAARGYIGDASGGDENMYIGAYTGDIILNAVTTTLSAKANGRVGIGTNSPAEKLEVRGNVRLGSTGEYFATAGPENLRIIRGKVSAAGSIQFGSGFTVTHSATGVYNINFSPAYPSGQFPIITASAEYSSSGARIATVNFPSHITGPIRIVNGSGTAVDADFYFIAVGPR